MNQLPDGLPTTVGQPGPLTDEAAAAEAKRIIREAMQEESAPTSYRDDRPLPVTGDAPPVAQPGIPPMSQRTTEIARAVMYSSLATVPPGLIAVAILVASEHANPTVIGMICAAPAAIAAPILALARLMRRTGEALPAEHHHHYSGPVQQHHQHVHSQSRLWGKTTNNL